MMTEIRLKQFLSTASQNLELELYSSDAKIRYYLPLLLTLLSGN